MLPSDIWFLVASGPSRTLEDIEYARSKGVNIAACNREFEWCPDAKVFFASDYGFWKTYRHDVLATLSPECEMWTSSTSAAREFKIPQVEGLPGPGFSRRKPKCHLIGLAGCSLIQVVSWRQPKLMLLTGFDTQKTEHKSHHFGDYPDSNLANPKRKFHNVPHLPTRLSTGELVLSQTDKTHKRKVARQVECFDILAQQCPIKIINCSRETALTCFERATVQEVLP